MDEQMHYQEEKTLGDLWAKFLKEIDDNDMSILNESLLELIIVLRLKGFISKRTFEDIYSLVDEDLIYSFSLNHGGEKLDVFQKEGNCVKSSPGKLTRLDTISKTDFVAEIVMILFGDVYIRKYIKSNTSDDKLFDKIKVFFDTIPIPFYFINNKYLFIHSVYEHEALLFWERSDKLFFIVVNGNSDFNSTIEFKSISIEDIPPKGWKTGESEKESLIKTLAVDGLVEGYSDSFRLQEKLIDFDSEDDRTTFCSYIVYQLEKEKPLVTEFIDSFDVDPVGQSIYDKNLLLFKNKYILICEHGNIRFVSNAEYCFRYKLLDENYIFAARNEELPLAQIGRYKDKRIYLYPMPEEDTNTISSTDIQRVLAADFKRTYLKSCLFFKLFHSEYADRITDDIDFNVIRRMIPTLPLSVDKILKLADTLYEKQLIDFELRFYMRTIVKFLSEFGYGGEYDVSYILYNLSLISLHLKKRWQKDNDVWIFSPSVICMLINMKKYYRNPVEILLNDPDKVVEFGYADINDERVLQCGMELFKLGVDGSISEKTLIGSFSLFGDDVEILPANIRDFALDPLTHRIGYLEPNSSGRVAYDTERDKFILYSDLELSKIQKKNICDEYNIGYRNCIFERI